MTTVTTVGYGDITAHSAVEQVSFRIFALWISLCNDHCECGDRTSRSAVRQVHVHTAALQLSLCNDVCDCSMLC